MPHYFTAERIYTGGRFQPATAIAVDGTGTITAVLPAAQVPDAPDTMVFPLEGKVLIPGAVNAHSHAFQILLRGVGDNPRNFRDWVDRFLYPLVLSVDDDALRLSARLAFAEMVKNGVTTVGEFFYLHKAKGTFKCRGNKQAEIVIAAAKSVGLRVHLLRCLYDADAREGQKRFAESVGEAEKHARQLRADMAAEPLVTVGPAPHSLHGASQEMIQMGMGLAQEWDTPLHIHLAEQEHDLAIARERYGATPLRALEQIGALNSRTCLVHGIWLDPEELDALGHAGGKLVSNPLSNMALGDGIADLPRYLRAGATVALGCDGPCANNQVNLFAEMRTAEWLQRTKQLEMGILPAAAPEGHDANPAFTLGTVNGGTALGLPIGRIEAGRKADFVALDPTDPSLLPHHGFDDAALLNNIVHAMAPRGAVTDVVINGEFVMRDRALTKVDEAALLAEVAEYRCPVTPGG